MGKTSELLFAIDGKPVKLPEAIKHGQHLRADKLAKQLENILATPVSSNDAKDLMAELGTNGYLRPVRGIKGMQFEMCGRSDKKRTQNFIDLFERPVEAAFGNN